MRAAPGAGLPASRLDTGSRRLGVRPGGARDRQLHPGHAPPVERHHGAGVDARARRRRRLAHHRPGLGTGAPARAAPGRGRRSVRSRRRAPRLGPSAPDRRPPGPADPRSFQAIARSEDIRR